MSAPLIPSNSKELDTVANRLGLTNKERLFCEAYVKLNFNVSEAHKYVYKGVVANAYRLLAKPKIQTYLANVVKLSLDSLGLDKDHVIRVLADIAFFDVTTLYCKLTNEPLPLSELSQHARNAIKEVLTSSYKVSKTNKRVTIIKGYILHDKSKALEMLGKHFGIFEKDNNQSRDIINQQYNITWN